MDSELTFKFFAFPKSQTFMDTEADEPTKKYERGQVTRELQNFGIKLMLKKGYVEV